jgi:protein-tyrosine-phosphatase
MAEALARHFADECIEPFSAGFKPLGSIPPFTLEALAEVGISTGGLYSKGLSEVWLHQMDYLVDLTTTRAGRRMVHAFSGKVLSYPVRDPFGHDLEAFRQAREKIGLYVSRELPRLVCWKKRFWWLHPKGLLEALRNTPKPQSLR